MTKPAFRSPTMDWIYARDPKWASDREQLYKFQYSTKTMRDVRGYDVYGFDEQGVDRLGCTAADYEDPFIRAIGATCGEWMSLSNRLPTALPRFLLLKPMFEEFCRSRWDVEPEWVHEYRNLPTDGHTRLFTQMGSDFSIGVHWHDQLDGEDNFLILRTDTIAKLEMTDEAREIPFRIVSKTSGSEHELKEAVACASSVSHALKTVREYMALHVDDHTWTIQIVDTPDGMALRAVSNAELPSTPGHTLDAPVKARTREDALQHVMDTALSSSIARMASAGIQELIGQPVVGLGPRR